MIYRYWHKFKKNYVIKMESYVKLIVESPNADYIRRETCSRSLCVTTTFSSLRVSTTLNRTFWFTELDDICQLMKGMLCSDICVPTPGSYYCKCRDGFTLLGDGKNCSQDPSDRYGWGRKIFPFAKETRKYMSPEKNYVFDCCDFK